MRGIFFSHDKKIRYSHDAYKKNVRKEYPSHDITHFFAKK